MRESKVEESGGQERGGEWRKVKESGGEWRGEKIRGEWRGEWRRGCQILPSIITSLSNELTEQVLTETLSCIYSPVL